MTEAKTTSTGMTPEQDAQNAAFAQLCAEKDLLKRPAGLNDQDLSDGLLDLSTLLLVVVVSRAALLVLTLLGAS